MNYLNFFNLTLLFESLSAPSLKKRLRQKKHSENFIYRNLHTLGVNFLFLRYSIVSFLRALTKHDFCGFFSNTPLFNIKSLPERQEILTNKQWLKKNKITRYFSKLVTTKEDIFLKGLSLGIKAIGWVPNLVFKKTIYLNLLSQLIKSTKTNHVIKKRTCRSSLRKTYIKKLTRKFKVKNRRGSR